MTEVVPRCRVAIKAGTTLTTRCILPSGHANPSGWGVAEHEGRGLPEFPYQRIFWFDDDRRCFFTDQENESAWEAKSVETREVPDPCDPPCGAVHREIVT